MVRRLDTRSTWLSRLTLVAALAMPLPAAAQSTGMVKGSVKDEKGQPVQDAKVIIEMTGTTSRRFELKTDRKGEFFQIGVASGSYQISAQKDKLSSDPQPINVRAGQTVDRALVLAAVTASAAKEAAAKNTELKKLFEEGVALSGSGNHAGAIEKFNAGIALVPTCHDCYNNIGYSYAQMKDWGKAEEAYKKSIEAKADDAAAYNGLATVYNAQRKFDLAAQASAKATELSGNLSAGGGAAGGSAEAQFNQGVIFWNAGKIADAKKAFEAAVQANPNHAEAHYQLGMALVNEGNMAGAATEFETYMKLAPDGPNSATAKALLAQLKK